MLSNLAKALSVFVILVFSSGLTLANKVGLDNIAARAWTHKNSQEVALNVRICFKNTYVNKKKQKSNCLRVKSSMKANGVQQYEHIIFET